MMTIAVFLSIIAARVRREVDPQQIKVCVWGVSRARLHYFIVRPNFVSMTVVHTAHMHTIKLS